MFVSFWDKPASKLHTFHPAEWNLVLCELIESSRREWLILLTTLSNLFLCPLNSKAYIILQKKIYKMECFIECVQMTSQRPCWRSKQRNGGHFGGVKYFLGDWTLLLCKFLLLFQYANMACGHMSEHTLLRFTPLRKTLSPQVKNYNSFSRVFEIANQLLTRHSVYIYLAPLMKGNALSFRNVKKVGFFLSVRCLYNKENHTWLLGEMEFLFSCSTRCHSFAALTCEISSSTLEVKFLIPARTWILFYITNEFRRVKLAP